MDLKICFEKPEPCPCLFVWRSLAQEGKMIEASSEVSHSFVVFDSVSPVSPLQNGTFNSERRQSVMNALGICSVIKAPITCRPAGDYNMINRDCILLPSRGPGSQG